VRELSCHRCDGCRLSPPQRCTNDARCGVAELKVLTPKTAPARTLTRGVLVREGEDMGRAAKVGDLLAVELYKEAHEWMLCQVVEGGTFQTLTEPEENWFGRFEPGDNVLRVRCMKPEKPGSTTTFVEDDEHDEPVIPIFVEDIRFANIVLEERHVGVRTRRPRTTITAWTHKQILNRLVLERPATGEAK